MVSAFPWVWAINQLTLTSPLASEGEDDTRDGLETHGLGSISSFVK